MGKRANGAGSHRTLVHTHAACGYGLCRRAPCAARLRAVATNQP